MAEPKTDVLAVMLPSSLSDAVEKAARLNYTSKSEWARQALRRELTSKGLMPSLREDDR